MNRYQKVATATVVATLFLILVGGLVRASGAGLGCPDWPKCFGMWIPPTSPDQLPSEFDAASFNVGHTWMEYVNRLTGVVIGILITVTFLLSIRYRKTDPWIPVASFLAFLLVLIQGWLGGQVVRSGLHEGLITLHMVLAMVIVNTLLFASWRANRDRLKVSMPESVRMWLGRCSVILLVLLSIQLVLGTQVREMVDLIKNAVDPLPRELWIDALDGWRYPVHRSFSWLVLGVTLLLFRYRFTVSLERRVEWTINAVGVLILLQMGVGVGMDRFQMLGLFQVTHLVAATLTISLVFLLVLMIYGAGGREGNLE
ncbi:MAG: COX15/CtaA family protein [Bacteroidota bacterium]